MALLTDLWPGNRTQKHRIQNQRVLVEPAPVAILLPPGQGRRAKGRG